MSGIQRLYVMAARSIGIAMKQREMFETRTLVWTVNLLPSLIVMRVREYPRRVVRRDGACPERRGLAG
ncbi:hypothetical protein J2D73_02490 [Acetobacter sacchari]|uniref:Uncharacterized protein n=1 Tax=Acetobacter sacchari TaxID=2661687 RepID=A0ABS3LRZ2_9PROT|nr:hypothetical protein [Acetobacter sacchari]MBO1358666.1 hypothetical protein [Acetobacter sacchari]